MRCGAAKETVKHYLFTCRTWTEQRQDLVKKWPHKSGDVSFFLGGKSPGEEGAWHPELDAVAATMAYVRATGRFSETYVDA
jgi:hypothetical protein